MRTTQPGEEARRAPRLLLRYITLHVGTTVLLGLGVIVVFVSAGDLIGNLNREIRDGVPLAIVLRLQLLRIPVVLTQVSWVAMLAALLIVLGQMARRREYVAMLAGGISIFQLSAPVLFVACLVTLGVFGVQEGLAPRARESIARLRGIYARDGEADMRGPIENVSYFASGYRSYVIKQLDVDSGTATRIEMHRTGDGGIVESLHAAAGLWNPERRRWIWTDSVVRTFDAEQRILTEEHLPELAGRLRASPTELRTEKRLSMDKYSLTYMSIAQLRRRIITLARSAQAPLGLYMVYYAKWSEPVAAIIVALLAIPSTLSVERRGTVRGVVWCVGACLGFFVIRRVGLAMGRGGIVPPLIAAWAPHVLAGGLGTYWLKRAQT